MVLVMEVQHLICSGLSWWSSKRSLKVQEMTLICLQEQIEVMEMEEIIVGTKQDYAVVNHSMETTVAVILIMVIIVTINNTGEFSNSVTVTTVINHIPMV